MTPGRVRLLLFEFMADIYPGKSSDLETQYGDFLNELGGKLSKVLSKEQEIDEYLNSILEYIDGLNQFFAKQPEKSRIPYSKLLTFANKDERISGFLLDKGLKKKLSTSSGIDVAGYDSEDEEEAEDIIYDNEVYEYLYSLNNRKFFFSPVINKVAVQYPSKKIISYSLYRRKARKKGKKYIKLVTLHRALSHEKQTEIQKAFQKHIVSVFSAAKKARKR